MNERLNNKEAAIYLGVAPNTLNVWRTINRWPDLPYIKIGNKIFYRKTDLDKFLDARVHGGEGALI